MKLCSKRQLERRCDRLRVDGRSVEAWEVCLVANVPIDNLETEV